MKNFKESLKVNLEESPETRIKKRLTNVLIGQIEIVKNDPTLTIEEKYAQSNIVFNILKFLQDYDNNIKILNENLYKNKFNKEK